MKESVILLHGLARTARSMSKIARSLEKAGYLVCNISYPSRKYPIEKLTEDFVIPEIRKNFPDQNQALHFVTHSMGGIILRNIAKTNAVKIGRAVMLSPPNHGSEVVDKLGHLWLFKKINGPAGAQMGTGAISATSELGAANFELGIISGNKSVNLLLSLLIPGANDGKVSIESAKLDGMKDFLAMPCSHPFIMNNDIVVRQTINFLKNGNFINF